MLKLYIHLVFLDFWGCKLETSEQLTRFRDFFESNKESVHEAVARGEKSAVFDFKDLLVHDPELADSLLDDPENLLKAAELSIENLDLPSQFIRVRFNNLPATNSLRVRDIRSIHLDKFISIEGLVRQTSDVRPQVTSARFECPSCGNTMQIIQIDTQFKEPSRCSCGRRGRFRLISKDLVDAQRIVIEESSESLDGGEQPKRLAVFLKGDLVEPKMERRTTPGTKVKIIGILKEVAIPLRTGGQSTRFDLVMESNFIEPIEETFEEINITKKEEEEILELSKDPRVYQRLISSIAPSIYGHEDIKAALVLQLMGGVQKIHSDGTKRRGDMHVLLIGDPGVSKSQLLQFISKIAPKARLVSGKGASSAGLCVAPDSLTLTNPGKSYAIKDLVEERLKNNEKIFDEGIIQAQDPKTEKKLFTLDKNLKIKTTNIEQFWKIKTPEKMVEILTQNGKSLILTPNTKLYAIKDGIPFWKESNEIIAGDYVAAARNLEFENNNRQLVVDLLKSNPIIHGIKNDVKKLIEDICKKEEITKRELAKILGISEHRLYHLWVAENRRGNVNLNDLKKLVEISSYKLEEIAQNIKEFSLYNGHNIKLPVFLNKDLLYFAGLIAGDGDLSDGEYTVTIRLSNNDIKTQEKFTDLSKKLFGINTGISSERSEKRAESRRFSSKLVFEILNSLGIPLSPKSHKLDMSNILLNLPHDGVASFLKGYFDSDGGPVEREKGSNYIECSSTSEKFVKKLQLLLLRFNIQAKYLTKKQRSNERVNSKKKKHILKLYGRENLINFRDKIGFEIEYKKEKLDRIINKIRHYNTNVDIIPGANNLLRETRRINKLTSKEMIGYKTSNYFSGAFNISRHNLSRIADRLEKININNLEEINSLAHSDILWEKIVEKKEIKPKYNYVYDLTVKDSHNFLVNGIVVHNTATVVKDEFLRGWALEAGAFVLANGGFCVIDEMDKINPEDISALHQALEQQIITIAKANIQATLKAQTTLLAAANPKLGRFDPYLPIASQINMPATLINRFDLIFPIRDIPSREFDDKVATHVLNLQQRPDDIKTEFSPAFLKKYICYARQKIKPVLTKEAVEEIKNFYVGLRNLPSLGEQELRPIPISARQLEALVRLAEGSARVRLSKKVTKKDSQMAIETLKRCLMQVGFDPETGQIDIDRISTGITTSQRSKIVKIQALINELTKKIGKRIPIDDLIMEASEQGIEEEQVNEAIEILKRDGTIYQPSANMIEKI